MYMKLEVVVVPVSEADRAKSFYEALGWRLDADRRHIGSSRVIRRLAASGDRHRGCQDRSSRRAPGPLT